MPTATASATYQLPQAHGSQMWLQDAAALTEFDHDSNSSDSLRRCNYSIVKKASIIYILHMLLAVFHATLFIIFLETAMFC